MAAADADAMLKNINVKAMYPGAEAVMVFKPSMTLVNVNLGDFYPTT